MSLVETMSLNKVGILLINTGNNNTIQNHFHPHKLLLEAAF